MSSADRPEGPFDPVDNPQSLHENALILTKRRCALALQYLVFLSRSWDPIHRRFDTVVPEHNPVEFNLARAEDILKRLQLWAPGGIPPTKDRNNPWWSGLHKFNLPFTVLAETFRRNQHPDLDHHMSRIEISAWLEPTLWQSADQGTLTATSEAEFKAKCLRTFFLGFVEGGSIRPQHLF